MKKATPKQRRRARAQLQNSPRDRWGLIGQWGTVGIASAGGASAAAPVAGFFGANTLLGSTLLAKVLGGVFVTTTPAGWVLGCATAGGLAAYGVAKLIRKGVRADSERERDIRELERLEEEEME